MPEQVGRKKMEGRIVNELILSKNGHKQLAQKRETDFWGSWIIPSYKGTGHTTVKKTISGRGFWPKLNNCFAS